MASNGMKCVTLKPQILPNNQISIRIKMMFILMIMVMSSVNAGLYNPKGGRNSMLRTRVITTRYGKLQGIILPISKNVHLKPVEIFLGIPYATPPLGINRFSPTRTPLPWDGVKFFDTPGPACPQRLPDISNETAALQRMPKGRLEYLKRLLPYLSNQSEDCLYMNMYAPVQAGEIPEKKYPVIIFIHGESFEWNSGNPYDGSILTSYTNTLVITINYRLGVLGFLNANPTPHIKARVANYGLMDQIAALHWVQQNIELFGGDPKNVTLLGHGSGAACINFLMVSPTVMPGLFHRAVLLSGSALSSWALVEDPVNYAIHMGRQLNCTIPENLPKDHELIVDCLREATLEDLMSVEITPPSYLTAFGPSVDGVVIKTDYAKELLTFFIPNDKQGLNSVSGANNYKDVRSSERNFAIKSGQNKYDLLFGVVTSEALWRFSAKDIQSGFEGERRDKIIRTYVRNTYTYHLSEILFTIVNEYTDWERTNQHPINTRDATIAALSDAEFVAPLVQIGDFLSVVKGKNDTGAKTYFYVFDYQTKDGYYPQKMGTVHGEELPYLFGAPLINGFNHFPRNYTKFEVTLSEAYISFITNFARTGDPNDYTYPEYMPISREKSRLKTIVWDEFDMIHQKYLEISPKPRLRNHYRAHQLSVWLRLIPELHRSGMKDVIAKHNLFRNHNDGDLYDGAVRPDPLTRTTYYDPTLELYRRPSQNVTLDLPQTTMDTMGTTCINAIFSQPGSTSIHTNDNNINNNNNNNNNTQAADNFTPSAISISITIGCVILILNVMIFVWVYYRRDRNKMQQKNSQQKNCDHENSFDNMSGKHSHYFMGHSQSSSAIVDVDIQDKNSIMMTSNISCGTSNEPHFSDMNPSCQNMCMMQKASPRQQKAYCTTLPRKVNYSYQQQPNNQVYNANCMTLPKNITFTNPQKNLADIQQTQFVHQPNGSVGVHMSRTPPPSRSKTPPDTQGHLYSNQKPCGQKSSRMPQVAMSEMNV